jgi:hypothetical protein
MKQFHTPNTELMVDYIKQALVNGDITDGVAQELSVLMMGSARETADIMKDIHNKSIESYKYKRMWYGFGLGIIATLAVIAVVFAAIHNFN